MEKNAPAEGIEGVIWKLMLSLITDPDALAAALYEAIEREKRI
jgi:hypothetical protein